MSLKMCVSFLTIFRPVSEYIIYTLKDYNWFWKICIWEYFELSQPSLFLVPDFIWIWKCVSMGVLSSFSLYSTQLSFFFRLLSLVNITCSKLLTLYWHRKCVHMRASPTLSLSSAQLLNITSSKTGKCLSAELTFSSNWKLTENYVSIRILSTFSLFSFQLIQHYNWFRKMCSTRVLPTKTLQESFQCKIKQSSGLMPACFNMIPPFLSYFIFAPLSENYFRIMKFE